MLSPEYLRMITELTEQKVSEVNEYLTAKIINRIIKLFEETGEVKLIPSSLLDLKKQQFAGRLLDEIQMELEKQLPGIQKEIRKAFHDAGAKIADDVNTTTGEILRTVQQNGNLADVSMPKFESKQKASKLSDLNMTEKEISCLESAYRRTQGELYNLTKTSANSAQQTFIKACDTAYFKATHGTSLDTAIVEAIREVSEKGITTVHYASGHEDKIEVAIARAVRAGVNQANGDITLTRCAEVGVNYVITSSHIGARVTPYADYRTHADWQGQVYSLDWNRPELSQYEPQVHEAPKGKFAFLNDMKEFFQNQKNKKYKDFIETCGYGKMLGICGINCRHSFGLFYPGISINNQIQYDSEENKKRYQREQKQRAMERGIRLIKRELNGLDSSGSDTEEAKMRKRELKELLQTKDAEYKAYCQKNGLKPLNYRLQVAKVSGVNNVGVVKEISQAKTHTKKIYITDIAINKVKKIQLSGYSESELSKLQEKHKELLKLAMNENNSNEVVNMFSTEFGETIQTFGDEKSVLVSKNPDARAFMMKSKINSVIWVHNHPKGKTFSYEDIASFLQPQIKTFSIVTNQGKIYCLNKTNSFSLKELYGKIKSLREKYKGYSDYQELVVKDLLKEIEKYGVEYIR